MYRMLSFPWIVRVFALLSVPSRVGAGFDLSRQPGRRYSNYVIGSSVESCVLKVYRRIATNVFNRLVLFKHRTAPLGLRV